MSKPKKAGLREMQKRQLTYHEKKNLRKTHEVNFPYSYVVLGKGVNPRLAMEHASVIAHTSGNTTTKMYVLYSQY